MSESYAPVVSATDTIDPDDVDLDEDIEPEPIDLGRQTENAVTSKIASLRATADALELKAEAPNRAAEMRQAAELRAKADELEGKGD